MKLFTFCLAAALMNNSWLQSSAVSFRPGDDGARNMSQPLVPACGREALSIKEGETEAAMGGVRQTPYTLTNTSSSPCILEGYPSVEVLNRQGKVVRRSKKQKVDEEIVSVTVEPGKTAWFSLNFNSGGAGYMGKPCPTYKVMKITVPGADRAMVLRTSITSCSESTFEVSPVHAGSPNE